MRIAMIVMGLAAAGLAAAPVAAQPAAPWKDYRYPERGFAVAFPAPPKVMAGAVAGTNAGDLYQYQAATGPDLYAVSVMVFSPGRGPVNPKAAYFAALMQSYARASAATLGAARTVKLAGRRGVEAVAADAAHNAAISSI
jgi:hypothetical protein